MEIEVLYVADCPSYEPLMSRLRVLLRRAGIEDEIAPRLVESEEHARRLRFVGSPTVRIDGRDVEPEADARTEHGVACRLYRTADGTAGLPPDRLIMAALRAAAA
ncbi:MAG: DF family (seleno)protein [Solirubrobacteraceae bacterium]